MGEKSSQTVTILPLVSETCAGELQAIFAKDDLYHVLPVHTDYCRFASAALSMPRDYWRKLPLDQCDVVLLEITNSQLDFLTCDKTKPDLTEVFGPDWPDSVAKVALLPQMSLSGAAMVVQMGFDGILLAPLDGATCRDWLGMVVKRHRSGIRKNRRHDRLRRLCSMLNRKRRRLREQIDLLCRDLVQSNVNLTRSLQELRRVCDFQALLTGEFDLQHMLYHALRHLRTILQDKADGAIFLCDTGNFEAHIATLPILEHTDLTELEAAIEYAVVSQVVGYGQAVLVDVEHYPNPNPTVSHILEGLSLMGLPLIDEGIIVGVVVFYCLQETPLSNQEMQTIQPLTRPLSRTTAALQRLAAHFRQTIPHG